jgi:hypothetical protein
MSTAFGYSETHLVAAVVELIKSGALKARIDAAQGTLVARKSDPRTEAFRNALEQGEKVQKRAKGAQLRCVCFPLIFSYCSYTLDKDQSLTSFSRHRLKLLQADLIVKPAKRSGGKTTRAIDDEQMQLPSLTID